MRQILKIRKMDKDKHDEQESLLGLQLCARDTPTSGIIPRPQG